MIYLKKVINRQSFILLIFLLPIGCKIDQLIAAKLPIEYWISGFNHEIIVLLAFAVLLNLCHNHRYFKIFTTPVILLLVAFNVLILISNTIYHSFGLIYKHSLLAGMPLGSQVNMVISYVTPSLILFICNRLIVAVLATIIIYALWNWKEDILLPFVQRKLKIIVAAQIILVLTLTAAFPHVVDEQELSIWISLKSFNTIEEDEIKPDNNIMSLFHAGKLQHFKLKVPEKLDLPKRDKPYNLIVFSMESTRAISSSAYGGLTNTAPFLSSVMNKGLFFENGYCNSVRSIKSLVPLLLGDYPYFGIHSWAWSNLSSSIRVAKTLPIILKKNGYYTSFFVNSDLEFDQRDTFLPKLALDHIEGAEEFISMDDRILVNKVDKLFKIAQQQDKPLFSILLSSSAHSPFKYPEFPHANGKILLKNAHKEAQAYGVRRTRSYHNVLYPSYLRSIRHQDDVAQLLYQYLEDSDLLKDTVFVVLGDHGESFGEHGYKGGIAGHGNSLYEESVRVPLWIHHPDLEARYIQAPVQFIDLVPTWIAMLNIDTDITFLGRNVLVEPRNTLFFSNFVKDKTIAVLQHPYKLIRDGKKEGKYIYELYNIERDPRERVNLIRNKELSDDLKVILAEFDIFSQSYQKENIRQVRRERKRSAQQKKKR